MKPRRPSHATVVAYLALFVALGGTAWAALHVGSKDVVNNSLKSSDLRNRKAVGGKDVVPNSLGGRQIDESSLNPNSFLSVSGSQPQGRCALSNVDTTCASTRVSASSAVHEYSSSRPAASTGRTGPNSAVCKLHLDDNASIFGSRH